MDRDTLRYVLLRLLLRVLPETGGLRARILRGGGGLPTRQDDPETAVAADLADLTRLGRSVVGSRVLVSGCGPSNGRGYALMAAKARKVWCHDPLSGFQVGRDAKDLNAAVVRHPGTPFKNVGRIRSLDGLPPGGVDIILLASLLERSRDPFRVLAGCRRALAPDGLMLVHLAYDDVLADYPFHALCFSKAAWRFGLGGGKVPRWRFDDHLGQLAQAGFEVTALELRRDPEGLAKLVGRLNRDFERRDSALLSVTGATLCCRPAGTGAASAQTRG